MENIGTQASIHLVGRVTHGEKRSKKKKKNTLDTENWGGEQTVTGSLR